MPTYRSLTDLPPLVTAGLALAERLGFRDSCTVEVGRLLRLLAGLVRDGAMGEVGTGCGVGTAWLAAGLGAAGRLVTVEGDECRARAAAELLRPVPNATVLHDDWRAILVHGPFDLLFIDAAPAKAPPATAGGSRGDVLSALRPGGLLVMDDFTPEEHWPPAWRGCPDPLREYWLNEPRLRATELLTTPTTSVILATRIA